MKKKTWSCNPYTIELVETGEQQSSLSVIGPISNKNVIQAFDAAFQSALTDSERFAENAIQAVNKGYSIINGWFIHPVTKSEIHAARAMELSAWEFSRIIK